MSVLEPSKMPVPFASGGLKNVIPQASDPVTGRAGYNQGWTAINMTAKEAGGIPPFGQDFNGILYDITNAIRFTQQGGFYTYDTAFATAIGGYTRGAVLVGKNSPSLYQNQVDGNLTDPEGVSASGWARFGPNSYGLPMIGELVMWPSASMPQEIFPDIGATFIPYIGQSFSKTTYPLLAKIHPSGVLPADMRGEFARGWDSGRGVDAGRELMSAQGDAGRKISGEFFAYDSNPLASASGVFAGATSSQGVTSDGGASYRVSVKMDSSLRVPTASEFRPRNIAWNMIVRAK